MSQSTSINIGISATQTTTGVGKNYSQRASVSAVVPLTDGTAAGAADVCYFDDSRVLGSSAAESLDLSGSLLQPDGSGAVFVTLKGIEITNTGAGSLTVSRPASNGVPFLDAAADAFTLSPGSTYAVYDASGYTVTAGTGDLITFTADPTGCTYRVIFIGTSA